MESKIRIAAIIIQGDKILMLKGKGYKELWTPGGETEERETDDNCLKRELKEEIGVELVESKFFKEYIFNSFYRPEKVISQRVYIATISGEIKVDSEIDNYVWFTKKDFETKKYSMITNDQNELIPDLIKAGVW